LRSTDPRLAERVRRAARRREDLHSSLAGRRARLPLRYWRQQAHFTTPAADEAMARKALEQGTAPMARILERMRLTGRDLADRLAIDGAQVEELLAGPRPAPLVMLDGEDAQALRDDVTERGLQVAADLLREPPSDQHRPSSLRFFRPPGFNLPTSVHDLYTVLWRVAGESTFPLDGIVFPKVEQPEEVALLYELLDDAEAALGLPQGQVRVAFLIESGWAAANLAEIARVAAPRLCSLIFGLADYSADLGLPEISGDHPLAGWARAEIVNAAGAVGVPAIDAMTLAYPVGDPALDLDANRVRFLDRMALVYDDAVGARKLGMLGKWVGHPAQLFAVLLAFEAALRPEALEAEASKLAAYQTAVEDEARGAMMIGGVMSDRATDRHARAVLRQAVAVGRFPAERALALGIIEPDELEEARGIAVDPIAAKTAAP
jgi:citrate lyase beta subunit